MACCTRSSSHTVAAYCGSTNIPRTAGGGAGGRDHSYRRLLRPAVISVRPPGSGRTDQVRADGVRSSRCRLHHGSLDDDAGGGVPPQCNKELARQGDDDRLAHPPAKAPDRSWYHRLSAEVGWFCSHSQASSTIVVL